MKRAENIDPNPSRPQAIPAAPQELAVQPSLVGGIGSLVEFSTEAHVDPNEGLVFGDSPVHCACPHCERSVITFIDHESSWVTWVLGFVVWFSLGWMAFWVLPLLWPAFKDVVHHCPRCLNVIARKSRISVPTFKSEVMTFKIGSCAVVLARKYVMIAAGLVGLILTVYVLRSTVHLQAQEVEKGPPSMLTWEDFLFDCGPRTSLSHRSTTSRSFEERYRKRTFKWQGEVRNIREGFDVWLLHTKSVIMVRMYPSRFPRRDLPDVALLFGDERNSEVAELNPGDWVEFEASMTAHGHRGDPEVMMLWGIKIVPKPTPLSSSAGAGRHGDTVDKHGAAKQQSQVTALPTLLTAKPQAPAEAAKPEAAKPDAPAEPKEAIGEAKPEAAAEPVPEVPPQPKPEAPVEPKPEAPAAVEPKPVEAKPEPEAAAEPKPEVPAAEVGEAKPEVPADAVGEAKPEVKAETQPQEQALENV